MILNQYTVLQSACVRSFLRIRADEKPESMKTLATAVKTESIAIIPNWSGIISLARIIETTKVMTWLAPCSAMRHNTPLTALRFKDCSAICLFERENFYLLRANPNIVVLEKSFDTSMQNPEISRAIDKDATKVSSGLSEMWG